MFEYDFMRTAFAASGVRGDPRGDGRLLPRAARPDFRRPRAQPRRLHRRDRRDVVRPFAARRAPRLHRDGGNRHGLVRGETQRARRRDRHDAFAGARPRPAVPAFLHAAATQATALLFGNVLGVDDAALWTLVALAIGSLAALGFIARPLIFASLQAELAEARGVPLRVVSVAFLAIVAIAVAECAQIVGVLLVFTLMVGPAAAARNVSRRLGPAVALSAGARAVRGLGRPDARVLHRLAGELLDHGAVGARLFRQSGRSWTAALRRRGCGVRLGLRSQLRANASGMISLEAISEAKLACSRCSLCGAKVADEAGRGQRLRIRFETRGSSGEARRLPFVHR